MQRFGQGLAVLPCQRMGAAQQVEQRQQADAANVVAKAAVGAGDEQQFLQGTGELVRRQQYRSALIVRFEVV